MKETDNATIRALRTDVADRDRHVEELIATHTRQTNRVHVLSDANKTLERLLSDRSIRLDRVQDLIDNPRGRSFQMIVEEISEIIREDEP